MLTLSWIQIIMNSVLLSTLLSAVYSQDECIYSANDGSYVFNLTSVSRWTLEHKAYDNWYYYTPCRNGLRCSQGNANFYANTAQYEPMENQCLHYLSVDHHEQAQYSFIGGSWRFEYNDGELCDATQSPRKTSIYYHCNNVNNYNPALLETVDEPQSCNYYYSIASTLACVPQSVHNANCQWRTSNDNGGYYYLDLSQLKGTVVHQSFPNGYDYHYSICSNSLHCYQQQQTAVMSTIDNRQTGTCEISLAVWEQGQVQPLLHQHQDESETHWTFHYWNGQTCSNGQKGEQKVRFFCDADVDTYKVLGSYGEGNCIFDVNISSKAACINQEQRWVDAKKWFQKEKKKMKNKRDD